jgi:hypothetical protein
MGVYGSVLRITYRNTSAFPIRGIEFGIEALDTERNNLRPNAIINYHPLASNAGQVLIWNSTRFDKKNGANHDFIVWPVLIQLGHRLRWVGAFSQCSYRSNMNGSANAAVSPASQNMQQLQALIAEGEASLVSVTSDPSLANVDVDGVLLGKTPLSFVLKKTTNGAPRNIMVYKDGFTIRDRDVTPSGRTITIHEHLISIPNAR